MRTLVTGATGFLGSRLVHALLDRGETVHAVARAQSDVSGLDGASGGLTVHRHDGSTDHMVEIVEQARPDAVFHLAAFFVAEHRQSDISPLIESNLHFGVQLVEAMAIHRLTRLVNTGTSWQHLDGVGYNPVGLYAATKEAYEAMLSFYVEAEGFQVVTLKLFDTYGPQDRRRKLLSVLHNASRSGERLAMSEGRQRIDLVYVDDAIDAFIVAGDLLVDGQVEGHETYAVGSGKPRSLREIVEVYQNVTGARLDIEWGARSYRRREVMEPWSGGGAKLAGWSPRVPLEQGIRKMLDGDAGS